MDPYQDLFFLSFKLCHKNNGNTFIDTFLEIACIRQTNTMIELLLFLFIANEKKQIKTKFL